MAGRGFESHRRLHASSRRGFPRLPAFALDTIALMLGDIGEEVPEAPGDWSIAEILNHLLDAERRYFARVRRLKREANPRTRVMPDADVTTLTALQAWKAFYELRRRHVRLLRSLKPARAAQAR